jgi:ankyrin repeat protein
MLLDRCSESSCPVRSDLVQMVQYMQLILSSHRSNQAKASLAEIGADVLQVRQEMVSIKTALETYQATPQAVTQSPEGVHHINYDDSAQSSKQVVRNTKTRRASGSYFYGMLSFHGTMSSMWNDEQATYFVSLRSRLPLSRLFVADVALRTHPLTWPSLSILRGGGLAIKHVVPEDAAIMKACSRGDTFQIRELFSNKEASPNDVTESNSTPMLFAIESGNAEAVELLIRQGADVNWTFGRNQTSPLAWALGQRKIEIARLLVSHGGSFDHVSAFGWSPLFYLWVDTEALQRSAVEYLNILSAKPDFSILHNGLLDINGWGVIHRVVAFGTTDEVTTLLRLGANPFEVVAPLRWTAIHHAVYYGRYETFLELLPYYKHVDIDDPDERGWTLLHIGASAGHEDICKHLISLGADWRKRSWKFYSHMPDCLHGGSWTPAEVAGAQSEERRERLMRVVLSSGKLQQPPGMSSSHPDLPELWFDAPEAVAA